MTFCTCLWQNSRKRLTGEGSVGRVTLIPCGERPVFGIYCNFTSSYCHSDIAKRQISESKVIIQNTSRSHPAWAALSRPVFGFCCHVFCFLEGEAHFAGFSTPPVLPCKGTKIMRTGQIFARLFSGISHQNSASRIFTIDNRTHFPEGSEPASAEREAQTPRLLNLRLPKDAQEEFQASSA